MSTSSIATACATVLALLAAALPSLAQLPWTELANDVSDQAVAALHFLEVAYVILTL